MTTTQSTLDRLRSRPPATATYTFTFDPAAAQRIADAKTAVDDARFAAKDSPAAPKAKAAVTKAKKALDALVAETVTVTVVVKAVGTPVLEQLRHEHPPTELQQEMAEATLGDGERLIYDPATYGPAALAISLVRLELSDDPAGALTSISEEDASTFWEQLAQMDKFEILGMINSINLRGSKVDLVGKG